MPRFTPCACRASQFVRTQRAAWMRLFFPSHALYQCSGCRRKFLASPAVQADIGMRRMAEHSPAESQPPQPSPSPLPDHHSLARPG